MARKTRKELDTVKERGGHEATKFAERLRRKAERLPEGEERRVLRHFSQTFSSGEPQSREGVAVTGGSSEYGTLENARKNVRKTSRKSSRKAARSNGRNSIKHR